MSSFSRGGRTLPNLVDVLQHRAADLASKSAFTFLSGDGAPSSSSSFTDLDRRARAIAVALLEQAQCGDRVLLLLPPGAEYIASFFGAMYAGMIAVPAYPPDRARLGRSLPRLLTVLRDADCAVICTAESIGSADRAAFADAGATRVRFLATDSVTDDRADSWRRPTLTPDTIAFLQYTSGSTGDPKGVVLTHGNLSAGSSVIQQSMGTDKNNLGVSWLPPFHDMGLVGGVLQPVWTGASSIQMAPLTFLRDPKIWLSAISGQERVVSGGPNFALDWCVRRTSAEQRAAFDLRGWEVAFCGAEQIRADTMRRFVEAFSPAGFSPNALFPCYGLAEATLLVTGAGRQRGARLASLDRSALELGHAQPTRTKERAAATLVGCGVPASDLTVAVVSQESGVVCPDGQVGELWVSGPAVAAGYWQKTQATVAAFGGQLPGRSDNYLRTGDLGFIDADGEFYVTGRIKDLLVIRGRNHYPTDIERTVELSSPALSGRQGAAFAVSDDDGERLVVVHEVDPKALDTPDNGYALATEVRAAVGAVHEVQISEFVAVRPRSIPKTSSGKVRRQACRADYLSGSLDTLGVFATSDSMTASDTDSIIAGPDEPSCPTPELTPEPDLIGPALTSWLLQRISRAAGIPAAAIDPDAPFYALGFDSASAVSLAAELQSRLGRTIPPTTFWDYPTPALLLSYLHAGATPGNEPGVQGNGSTSRPAGVPDDGAVAVIGIGVRLPRQVESADDYWEMLRGGTDAVGAAPVDRWSELNSGSRAADAVGQSARQGAFLDDVGGFDAAFFGISPREASRMDPQQRLILEVAWQALEHAGYSPFSLRGSETGVMIGISTFDYARTRFDPMNPDHGSDPFASTGNAHCIAANRLSYVLGLQGPSMAIDTACSSSLVAVHLAMQSLRAGECDLALAGGVNALLAPDVSEAFSQAGMLSPSGRCRTFDADADGYGRGEGCGVVVLKRLSDALRDGDLVRAVIRGSAVNHDGHSSSITAPNGVAQQDVMRRALAVAGVDPAAVGYVEAHGTATPLGDPIEIAALQAVYGTGRAADRPLLVGSAKTNIGHLEAAAGIAGLIKAVLMVQHGTVPAHLHLHRVNPHVASAGPGIAIPTRTQPWPDTPGPRVAAVSSFGFGGTNAHVVVEEPPARVGAEPADQGGAVVRILPISARTPQALTRLTARYADALDDPAGPDWTDTASTAATGRAALSHRLAVFADNSADAVTALRATATAAGDATAAGHATGGSGGRVVRGRAGHRPPRIGFLYTGQGHTRSGMAGALHASEPVFAAALEHAATLADPGLGHHLLELLLTPPSTGEPDDGPRGAGPAGPATSGPADPLSRTGYAQPALFAVEHALTALWASWGVVPDVVAGHSLGELVAACTAGVLTLPDAARLIATRARLMDQLPDTGAMHAVYAPLDRIRPLLARHPEISVAAVNGPEHLVLSGPTTDLHTLTTALRDAGVHSRRLPVSHAFHSALMDPVLAPFHAAVAATALHLPRLPLISTLTGGAADGAITTAEYWRRHLREPVDFAAALATLTEHADILVEIGPAPTLSQLATEQHPQVPALPSLHPDKPPQHTLAATLATLWTHGAPVTWTTTTHPGRRTTLPTYPFDHTPFRNPQVEQGRRRLEALARGEQLSAATAFGSEVMIPLASGDLVFQSLVTDQRPDYIGDHRLDGTIVAPAAFHVALALGRWASANGEGPSELVDAVFPAPMTLDRGERRSLQLLASPARPDGLAPIRVDSADVAASAATVAWKQHFSGSIGRSQHRAVDPDQIRPSLPGSEDGDHLDGTTFYELMAAQGFDLGHAFRWIEELWHAPGEAHSRLSQPDPGEGDRWHLMPAFLDSCFQTLAAATGAAAPGPADPEVIRVPISIERLYDSGRDLGAAWCTARLRDSAAPGEIIGDIDVHDADGNLLIQVTGLEVAALRRDAINSRSVAECLRVVWEPVPVTGLVGGLVGAQRVLGRWLVLVDSGGVGERLASGLVGVGGSCVVVSAAPGSGRAVLVDSGGPWPRWEVDPDAAGAWRELLAELGGGGWAGVASLWALDGVEADPVAAFTGGCGAPVQLLRAWAGIDGVVPPMWQVTSGAQPVTPEAVLHPAQAALWGLARVQASELPASVGGLIDLDPADLFTAVDQLPAVLTMRRSAPAEDQLAWHCGQWWRPRLHRTPTTTGSSSTGRGTGGGSGGAVPVLDPGAGYLVTGGLGALGLTVAAHLVHRGARHVMLLGRYAHPDTDAAVGALRAAGAEVRVVAADVTDRDQLAAAVAAAGDGHRLRGVVHAAGVLNDGLLGSQSVAEMAAVVAPKVTGGYLLDQLTRDLDLDFFVVFSSVAATLGAPGQGAYAAANAYLDTLAAARLAAGRPGTAIAWGPWAGPGMAQGHLHTFTAAGITPLTAASALPHLDTALTATDTHPATGTVDTHPHAATHAHYLVTTTDWARYTTATGPQPLLTHLLPTTSNAPQRPANTLDELLRLPRERRLDHLTGQLLEHVGTALGLPPGTLEPDTPLHSVGLDSLLGLELRNQIERLLQVRLPVTALLEGPSVAELAGLVMNQLTDRLERPAPPPPAPPEPTEEALLENLGELSEDELDSLIAQYAQPDSLGLRP